MSLRNGFLPATSNQEALGTMIEGTTDERLRRATSAAVAKAAEAYESQTEGMWQGGFARIGKQGSSL